MIFSSLKKTLRISLKKDAERKKNKLTDAPPRQNESSRLRLCGNLEQGGGGQGKGAEREITEERGERKTGNEEPGFFPPPGLPGRTRPA